ncbi:MAG TPA: cyclic nucleotide-binding domain-containing protein [Anaerolineaceae bacterium]|nr:cyclic nucleotide-binding domain-containing protein [Anaerolineaceae bacterium]HPN50861.1 cyclic nucleotide-binding domain-containing protein [Anaerolineaceae bacterium]
MGKYLEFLRQCDIFSGLSDTRLELIENICEEHPCEPDEIVFSENAKSDELYLITQGAIEILVNPDMVASQPSDKTSPVVIATLRRGQSFGEIALVDQGVRTATARVCQKNTRLLYISRKRLLMLCNTYPEMGYQVMHNLAADLSQKIRNADLRIREEVLYRQTKLSPAD